MIAINQLSFNDFSAEIYNNLIANLQIHKMTCDCGQSGCFVRHGYYKRKLKTTTKTFVLSILRLKCRSCGRTHALLPEIIVPYSQISVDCQFCIALHNHIGNDVQDLMQSNTDIDESNILYIRSQYKKHWKQRILGLHLSPTVNIRDLIDTCYTVFHRQFMQIRRGKYLKSKAST